jgi:hypothetical protein
MAQCPVCGARAAYFFEKANDGTGVCGEPKECKVEYNKILLSRGTSSNSKINNEKENEKRNNERISADRERREQKLEELRIKAEQEEREARRNMEISAQEKASRIQRARELRGEGKNFQAFLVEFQNGVVLVSLLLVAGGFFFYTSSKMSSEKEDALKIHNDLEMIEDSVKIYIESMNFDRALILVNELNHPLNENMEQMEFDAWNGYQKYDEYWAKKKSEYKDIILKKGSIAE